MIKVSIDTDLLVEGLMEATSRDDLTDLIIEIDLKVADAGFTEELVKRMMASLKLDYRDSPEDYASLLKELE